MSYIHTVSLEDRIRARIAQGAPDVPVFTSALHGTTRPLSAPSVRPLSPLVPASVSMSTPLASVLRVDSGRGQTPESTQRIEVSRVFREDPELVRNSGESEKLIAHVRSLSHGGVETQDLLFSLPTEYADAQQAYDEQAVLELAPPLWRPPAYVFPTWVSVAKEKLAIVGVVYLSLLFSILSDMLVFFGWVCTWKWHTKILNSSVRFLRKAGRFILSFFVTVRFFFAFVGDMENVIGRKLYTRLRSFLVHTGRFIATGARAIVSVLRKGIATSIWRIRRAVVAVRHVRISLPTISLRVRMPSVQVRMPVVRAPKLRVPSLPTKQILSGLGQAMIVGSIVIFLMTAGPIIRLQLGDWWQQSRVALTGKANEPVIKETLMDAVRKPEEVPPEEKQFQVEIPKIKANLKVIPNIDAGDEKAYSEALMKGVAHAAGSGLPGEKNTTNRTVYIFGHSTNAVWNIEKYNALFYSLKDMEKGDEISVWFWGKQFHYKVTNVVKIDPSDLTYLQPQTLKDQLILQTCWPPGTTWKRLLVIAEPVEV